MNSDIQSKIAQLVGKGWTLAAIADELGVTSDTVELWKAGKRNPTNAKGVLLMLDKAMSKKRIPKKKRYITGSRKFNTGDRVIGNGKKASYRGKRGIVIGYYRPTNEYQIRLDEDEEIHYVSPYWFDKAG